MNTVEAFVILKYLSNGVSPNTGKEYSKKNVICTPKIQKALKIAEQCLYDHEDMRVFRKHASHFLVIMDYFSDSINRFSESCVGDEEC